MDRGGHTRKRNRPRDPAYRRPDPSTQYVLCIDDREESFRRHLEEVDPEAETFGAPGNFGLAIEYWGADAGEHIALAPIGMRPRHAIAERVVAEHADNGRSRRAIRRRVLCAFTPRHPS